MSSKLTKHKTKKVKAVQQKKKLFRANEPVLSVFMWGVNYSITNLSHVDEPSLLLPEHFKAFSKVRVDNSNYNKENMPSHFRVKEYCPLVFRNIRERFNVCDDEFMNSLTKSQPIDQNETSGKSGARFFLSEDKLYIIKTVTSEEVEAVHALLAEYHQHVVEQHAKTLLPQYLAMYRVTGSLIDRAATDKEKSKDLPTFKDVDLINDDLKISIGELAKEEFMETLQLDVDWLTKLKLMDYSLLIGIHDCDRALVEAEQAESEENGERESSDDAELSSSPGGGARGLTPPQSPLTYLSKNPNIDPDLDQFAVKSGAELYGIPSAEESEKPLFYYMALIDILTHYGMKKRTANAAKQVKHGSGAEISTVKPEQYAKRFTDFINKIID
ncbi:PIP4K2B [Bugula neritina]|uniref:1-phosphatidylinositol-5-phosphate 4-kinase n=1 Tax=Bugula neritina TaxID=10212 RepID=A0A7J7IR54_BUGNE|nr:PIP4K2B [Bugula neritina]